VLVEMAVFSNFLDFVSAECKMIDWFSLDRAIKDNQLKCKHLFPVGSLPHKTLETAIRYKGVREPVPSSYWIDPLVLLHAQCIALIHARSIGFCTSKPLGTCRWETLKVFLKNPKGVTQDRTRNLRSGSQWSNQLSYHVTPALLISHDGLLYYHRHKPVSEQNQL
jgi:hypothetical protein